MTTKRTVTANQRREIIRDLFSRKPDFQIKAPMEIVRELLTEGNDPESLKISCSTVYQDLKVIKKPLPTKSDVIGLEDEIDGEFFYEKRPVPPECEVVKWPQGVKLDCEPPWSGVPILTCEGLPIVRRNWQTYTKPGQIALMLR